MRKTSLNRKVVTWAITGTIMYIIAMLGSHVYWNFRNNFLDLNSVVSYKESPYGIVFYTDSGEEYFLDLINDPLGEEVAE